MTFRRLVTTLVASCALAIAAAAAPAGAYAPAATAPVHPGVMTHTNGAQCTANFVFTGAGNTYLGQAAHCSGTGAATATDGCTSKSLRLGTPVQVAGASKPGTMVYNSWLSMQALGEKNPDTCAFNDLALIKLDPADVGKVNPSIPFWGGPTGLNTTGTSAGETVLSYGNSSLRSGIALLSPKQGISVGDDGGGYSHTVYTITPGIPGDSGSAFLDETGKALGILSTVSILPLPLSNGVGDVGRELAYANSHGFSASLVTGTESFRGPLP